MGEGKASSLLVILGVILSLVAFGFAIAAEKRRSVAGVTRFQSEGGILLQSGVVKETCLIKACLVGAQAFVWIRVTLRVTKIILHIVFTTQTLLLVMGPLAPGGNRAFTIIYFVSSWFAFVIGEACLIAGATKNAYHTKYRNMVYADDWSCESLRKGIFAAGAAFVVFTMILNVFYYMSLSKAVHQTTLAKPSIGMTASRA